ncbi:MAG TPA: putative porin [Lentimicrobium sp.]|nr:putative porin [Lentimicrobium sp.]
MINPSVFLLRTVAIAIIVLAIYLPAVSQDETPKVESTPSPDTASIFFTNINDRWPGEQIIHFYDTILDGFQYYLPTKNTASLYAVNGNNGLAYKSLIFSFPEYSGFRYTPFDYTLYKWTNQNINYYHTTGPYTRLFYLMGPGKEQIFNVTHSQNILGGLTIGLDMKLINSLGSYQRQKSDDISFAGTLQFVSKNERYVALGNYHNSRFSWRENGGIKDESAFRNNEETDRNRIPVYLNNADNTLKESGVQIRQLYYFGNKSRSNKVADSLVSDTIGPKKLHRYYDPTRSNFFRYTFTYSRSQDKYTDESPKSSFYNEILLDSTKTFDSIYYHQVSNDVSLEAGVGRAKGSSKAILLRIGIEHNAVLHKKDSAFRKTFTYLTPYAYLAANAFGITKVEGKIWTTEGAPFNGDKGIEGSISFPAYDNSERWGNLRVSASLNIEQPFYFYQHFHSNHFEWENSFGQQTALTLKSWYDHRYFKAGFNAYNISDYIYLGNSAHPVENSGSVSVTQIWAYTDIKWIYFRSQIYGVLQSSSNQNVISLPSFAGRMSLYFAKPLFKRALDFQAGFSAMYNTAYYADAYMPALRAYYSQHSFKTGNYPYIDAFINIRVKRAKMFLLVEHFNSGLMNYDYFMIPNYPMPDRAIKFGIAWAFYD